MGIDIIALFVAIPVAVMVGAIYTHLAFDSVYWALLPAFCLSFLMFIAYEANARRKRTSTRTLATAAPRW
ncbi:MAG: hypothetical protein ACOCV2_09040 [Persicimonas sp.]